MTTIADLPLRLDWKAEWTSHMTCLSHETQPPAVAYAIVQTIKDGVVLTDPNGGGAVPIAVIDGAYRYADALDAKDTLLRTARSAGSHDWWLVATIYECGHVIW